MVMLVNGPMDLGGSRNPIDVRCVGVPLEYDAEPGRSPRAICTCGKWDKPAFGWELEPFDPWLYFGQCLLEDGQEKM